MIVSISRRILSFIFIISIIILFVIKLYSLEKQHGTLVFIRFVSFNLFYVTCASTNGRKMLIL